MIRTDNVTNKHLEKKEFHPLIPAQLKVTRPIIIFIVDPHTYLNYEEIMTKSFDKESDRANIQISQL